jgi:GNAT superfamily N-acetyltransferase
MKVVRATEHDVYAVTLLMKRFEECTRHLYVNIPYASKKYQSMVRSGRAAIFMLKDNNKMVGALGCIKAEDPHSGELTAIETFWMVDPERRGKGTILLKYFDRWAKEEGCKKKAMIHLEDSLPDKLKKIYEKKGYQLVESHYMAVVT